MTDFPDSSQLSESQRDQLARWIAYFEAACQSAAEKVQLADFLPPPDDPLRVPTLWRLIPKDLERRRQLGEQPRLETYAQQYVELGGKDQLPAYLLYLDFLIARRYGEAPSLTDYQARFPRQSAELKKLIHEEEAVGESEPGASHRASHREDEYATLDPEDAHAFLSRPEWQRENSDSSPDGVASGGRDPRHSVGEGRYRLIRMLGHGQYGEVWEAEAQGGVRVAVKRIRFPVGHQMSKQEQRSLDVITGLRHPLLLQVHSYWVEHDHLIIATDLGDSTLEDRLKACQRGGQQGIASRELVGYVRDVADAIDFLHRKNVIHRDIKPANILLVDNRAKVGDFGLARVLEGRGDASMVKATTIGTVLFMGPEVFDGKAGPRTDQYSLAATYVELRTGHAPFSGGSVAAVMKAQLEKQPDLAGLDDRERRVLEKALAKNPRDRFVTCSDFANSLDKALQPPPFPWVKRIVQTAAVLSLIATLASYIWVFWLRFSVTPQGVVRVSAGDSSPFQIRIAKPAAGERQYDIEFSEVDGVRFEWEPTAVGAEAIVHVESVNRRDETIPIKVTTRMGWRTDTTSFDLQIQPAIVQMLPEGFHPNSDTILVRCPLSKRICHQEIVKKVGKKGIAVEFRLIPSTEPPTFYMMRNKVWNDLFHEFAAAHPDDLDDNSEWTKGGCMGGEDLGTANGKHPVFRVSLKEGARFARWLGGSLPTRNQWDRAAGLGKSNSAVGPFDPHWNPDDPEGMAINRVQEGPMEVGAAKFDVSPRPFCIRDMAANGFEWTRDIDTLPPGIRSLEELIALPMGSELANVVQVVRRGMGYCERNPLKFEQLPTPQVPFPNVPYGEVVYYVDLAGNKLYRDKQTSFRVVVELDDRS